MLTIKFGTATENEMEGFDVASGVYFLEGAYGPGNNKFSSKDIFNNGAWKTLKKVSLKSALFHGFFNLELIAHEGERAWLSLKWEVLVITLSGRLVARLSHCCFWRTP